MQDNRDNKSRTLLAARRLFFEHGFAGTSTADIAREAGTSKATLYAHYGSLEGVLQAVITAEVTAFSLPQFDPINDFAGFRDALVGFGTRLLRFLSQPDTIHFSRLMHEQARTRPEIMSLYRSAAYDGTAQKVGQLIEDGRAVAQVHLPFRGTSTGECYVAILKGHQYEMAILDATIVPYPDPEGRSTACFSQLFTPLV